MKIDLINRFFILFHILNFLTFLKFLYLFFEFLKILNFLRILWRTAPQKCENSVAHQARCATENIFVATILWRTEQICRCATETWNGAPQIVLSVVVQNSNSNTFHVQIFFRFKNIEKIKVNLFWNSKWQSVNSSNSLHNYFIKEKTVFN